MDMSGLAMGEQKVKSYLSRPGGIPKTLAFLVLLLGLGIWLEPILIKIVWDTITLVKGLAILGAVIFLVTNRGIRLRLQLLWDILMKYSLGLVLTWDPWILSEQDIGDMEKQQREANERLVEIDTNKECQRKKVAEKIEENKNLYNKAKAAQNSGMTTEAQDIAEQMQDNKDYIEQLNPMLTQLSTLSIFLQKFDEQATRTIAKAKRQLSMQKDLFNDITAGSKAANAVLRFFKGDPEKNAMREQSVENLRLTMSSRLANMKNAMRLSANYMKSIDLDKATSQIEGLNLLEKFNPEVDFALPEPEKVPVVVGGKVDKQYYNDLDKLLQ